MEESEREESRQRFACRVVVWLEETEKIFRQEMAFSSDLSLGEY